MLARASVQQGTWRSFPTARRRCSAKQISERSRATSSVARSLLQEGARKRRVVEPHRRQTSRAVLAAAVVAHEKKWPRQFWAAGAEKGAAPLGFAGRSLVCESGRSSGAREQVLGGFAVGVPAEHEAVFARRSVADDGGL